jgi:hypothetical protein
MRPAFTRAEYPAKSPMKIPLITTRLVQISFLTGALLVGNACNRTPAGPTAEDMAVARGAMPISEVMFKVRAGVSREEILAEVTRRKIPAGIVAATELQLSAYGAGPRLIAAMKDNKNILTEKQEQAYGRLMAEKDQTQTEAGQSAQVAPGQTLEERQARLRKIEEERDLQRREYLSQENMRTIEQNQRLQAARDREQANSTARLEGGRDTWARNYQQPPVYATPTRRYSTPRPISRPQ